MGEPEKGRDGRGYERLLWSLRLLDASDADLDVAEALAESDWHREEVACERARRAASQVGAPSVD